MTDGRTGTLVRLDPEDVKSSPVPVVTRDSIPSADLSKPVVRDETPETRPLLIGVNVAVVAVIAVVFLIRKWAKKLGPRP